MPRTVPDTDGTDGGPPQATELQITFFDAEGKLHTLRTVVDHVRGDGLLIQVPSRANPTVQVRRQPAHLPARLAGGPKLSLVGVDAESPPLLISARPVRERPRTSERRRFYRVGVDLPAYGDFWEGRVVDLSGGGCRLHFAAVAGVPEVGERFALRIHLPTIEAPLEITGRAVRCEESTSGGLWLGVEFVGLARREQDELVRYVFQRQRDLLRWGFIRPA